MEHWTTPPLPSQIRGPCPQPFPHLQQLWRGARSLYSVRKRRFLIVSSSQGHADVVSDGHVYVWQSNSPDPVEVLSGHTESVNAVAWNPIASRRIFASCSDDGTVRIWQPPVSSDEDGAAGEVTNGPMEDEGMVL